jgi:hypothetical protein
MPTMTTAIPAARMSRGFMGTGWGVRLKVWGKAILGGREKRVLLRVEIG